MIKNNMLTRRDVMIKLEKSRGKMNGSNAFNTIIAKVVPILKEKGVRRAGVFGSFARGEQTSKSDIDFLIKVDDSRGLFVLVELKREMKKKLGREVDLVEYGFIHPKIRKQALKEEVRII